MSASPPKAVASARFGWRCCGNTWAISAAPRVCSSTSGSPVPRGAGGAGGKLSAEQATAANVERAMMLRRLLLAGYQEPHVFASAAGPEIQRMVAVIDREIDQVLYETRVRRELFANTAGTVLELGGKIDGQGGSVTPCQGDLAINKLHQLIAFFERRYDGGQ